MRQDSNPLNMKMQPVRETNLGVYAWKRPNGKYLGDTDGNMFNVPALFGDLRAIAALTREAQALGYPEGEACFLPGQYRCTDEEYYAQVEEMLAGRRPDANPGRVIV